jgi:riboflavin synthase
VVERTRDGFRVHAIATTLSRTTLGEFEAGRRINLERPVAAGARFGGHFVQGHVDAVGTVRSVRREDEMVRVRFVLPATVAPYTVLHGSIALDGVSLTVNDLGDGYAEVALIPYTLEHTNLDRLAEACRINLEADLIGKHVVRALAAGREVVSTADDRDGPPRADDG